MEQQEVQQLSFDFESVQPHIISARHDDEVKLQLGEFAGPLDLLLFLIKQEQANIFDIPIARITDEYLKYIRLMKVFDIAVAGDFLVMATTLIEIKSKMLLPRDPFAEAEAEEMEDPREALVRQLLEHQKFKSAAQMLWTKATVEQSTFSRGRLETDDNNSETNATVFDLLNVFQKILSRHKEEVQMEIAREEMSLSDMLKTMRERISKSKKLNLNEFFAATGSKRELVLAFLAVLELVKASTINLIQEKVFGEIWAHAN
jgi:segregation and condensation protein A